MTAPERPLRAVEASYEPAPEHLSSDASAWWDAVVRDFKLEPWQFGILEAAADALDRMLAARALVIEHGELVADSRGGLKLNPACALERDSRTAYLRAVRELALDTPVPEARPPRRGGQRY